MTAGKNGHTKGSGIPPALAVRLQKLRDILKDIGSGVIAFSGGVDSSLLLRLAVEVLGEDVLAVTVTSPLLPRSEALDAARTARALHARHRLLRVRLSRKVLQNPPDRCYHCKKAVFSRLLAQARRSGLRVVMEGSHADDLGTYRPGRRALRELHVRSPLLEAGLSKRDIRRLARCLGLAVWDKPSSPCLATRLPYGERLTPAKFRRVLAAEVILSGLGFQPIRVRLHGDIARIEVAPERLERLLAHRQRVAAQLRALGIRYVCVDLNGYRSGSMDEVIG